MLMWMHIVWLALFVRVPAFLLDPLTCLVPAPCRCAPEEVRCSNLGIHTSPNFTAAQMFASSDVRIYLNNNLITDILDDSFSSLATSNATHFEFYLNDNQISSIEENAFSGIESEVHTIDLTNNSLTSLSSVLGKLTNLQTLLLKDNPIQSLASSAIFPLSRTVSELSFSLDNFQNWPNELHFFRKLSKLYIDGWQKSSLPLSSFDGVEGTITWLEITRSRLDRIPAAVCHLNSIRHLEYVSNYDTKAPIFEPCNHNLSTVHYLSLRDNNLQYFPDVLSSFTSLGFLDVSGNNIRVIESDMIPAGSPLTHVNLSGNALQRVPSAINALTNLRSLFLDNNRITSIERFDLLNLSLLRSLDLSNNPLEYISPGTFSSQTDFDVLNLQHTKLATIPPAVTSLSYINRLELQGTPVQCSCQMSYLRGWGLNASAIFGTCEGTGEDVNDFITNFLPYCP
ncbi:leucine-rich repeat and death domain-containing protein 1-like [Mya arenaria]|uniref:leucine-rich repeat and death domain-containing protein 1-like n=1 Tax=Mya arenaria TaxID=6604 RepID=UPI0022E91DA1|nr:leucine-rich repeat and death domain-containing protein 1-like [Mya arenaria]